MKKILLTALSLAIGSSLFATAETEVEARLQAMSCIVPVKIQESVTKRIKTMLHARKDTEKLIGRSASFFPIFDQYYLVVFIIRNNTVSGYNYGRPSFTRIYKNLNKCTGVSTDV